MSMKPGASTRPSASMTRSAGPPALGADGGDPVAVDEHVGPVARRSRCRRRRSRRGSGCASEVRPDQLDDHRVGPRRSPSTTGIQRHLSNAVHGCDRPSRTTCPTRSGSAGSSRRNACWSLTAVISPASGRAGAAELVGGQLRLRQPLVERDVPLARVQQRQPRFGPGDHPGPGVHGRAERLARPRRAGPAGRCRGRSRRRGSGRRPSAAAPCVVGRVRPSGAEHVGHVVEVGAAARGDHRRAGVARRRRAARRAARPARAGSRAPRPAPAGEASWASAPS